ncbi:hypothetical protein H9P43_005744 [Blastocladiella emersonii ATCC 22665]|nr:hypothetical protein H9P43_005744 [Blastocladiella emersonii ATCC 22665]
MEPMEHESLTTAMAAFYSDPRVAAEGPTAAVLAALTALDPSCAAAIRQDDSQSSSDSSASSPKTEHPWWTASQVLVRALESAVTPKTIEWPALLRPVIHARSLLAKWIAESAGDECGLTEESKYAAQAHLDAVYVQARLEVEGAGDGGGRRSSAFAARVGLVNEVFPQDQGPVHELAAAYRASLLNGFGASEQGPAIDWRERLPEFASLLRGMQAAHAATTKSMPAEWDAIQNR